ncbi:Splicing factor U2AF 50 kDa subunit [Histomonas meleagridis]|uniref:Splicing factor U2AF 50 kDa subunit n=1 Tax=Histomonas meleagridis TaxID=135588 RepID=UPI00355A40D6|nr:Splicing factor U2AF 50 kDa subunit [Histomonas meleagridis]KAH0796581.1 Splicing factor U2AF 50 kDa subunit [Histomonas meleagridis]
MVKRFLSWIDNGYFFFSKMMNAPQNPRYQRLKGGWFVGPEEYAQMGFTLGLPPGFYAPDKPEIRELVEKIKPQNGIILPSSITASTQSIQNAKKTVIISNVPLGITPEAIINNVNNQLQRRKLVSDPDPILSCEINNSKFTASLQMRTQKDAEAAVQLGTIIENKQLLTISWGKNPDAPIPKQNPNVSLIQNNVLDSIIVDSVLPLPSTQSLLKAFEADFEVSSITRPEGFEHAIVQLRDPSLTDVAIFRLNDTIVDGVKLRVRRAFIGENEGPNLLDKSERRKMDISCGPSNMLTVLSPYMREKPCVADVLNPEVPITVVIHEETERLQPSTGATLLIYNVAPQVALYDNEECIDIVNDIRDECNKYGRVLDCVVDRLVTEPLPSDYAVVKVTFEDSNDAKDAQIALSGRRYAGRLVITQLID